MRPSRIADTFARLRSAKQPGFVAYVTAGDPTLERTADILVSLADSGADVLEVGVPFSDPIVLFTYANPILRMGEDVFVAAAADAGVDGVLMLDLPVEEAGAFRTRLAAAGLDPIFLLSPTTTDERIRASAANAAGFLYVISRLGVTGARDQIALDAEPLVARIRKASDLPLALGFGISRPEHVAEACRFADAAVVGSALVNVIAEHGASADVAGKAGNYVRWLKGLA